MKRHGNLWREIVSEENITVACDRASKGKKKMKSVAAFSQNREEKLCEIRQSLLSKSFTTSRYQTKFIVEPKPRQIFILPFAPDRIVQHALMSVVEPIWDRLMIHDSYACRKGKGQHRGSLRTMEFVRKYKYCLKADISKFYPSIDHEILLKIIKRKIKCPDTLWLLDNIIHSFPGGKNTPIGNYTSQWFGNLYLNELDQYLKHTFKVGPYLRYCDDFCIFSDDKKWLQEMKAIIADFLHRELKLKYSFAEVFPVSQGVDFLGYRHFKKHILLRKRTAKRVKAKLNKLPGMLARGEISAQKMQSTLASIKGWMKWACTRNLYLSVKIDELEALCGAAQVL